MERYLKEPVVIHLNNNSYLHHITLCRYTWFDMNVLDETWRNLQILLGDRETELEKEARRQDLNDQLRQVFAEKANLFHRFVADTRYQGTYNIAKLQEFQYFTK